MLVEDNAGDAVLVRKALESHNVEGVVIVIPDGEEALQFIESVDAATAECPDLAIIDLNLPKRSGLEILEYLRHSAKWGKVPIVILSSSDVQTDKAGAARLGASEYLRKPTRLNEFLSIGAILRNTLDQSSLPR